MNETEWLVCRDPFKMLQEVLKSQTNRKCCLFRVACCRAVFEAMTNVCARAAVVVSERFADGIATEKERARAFLAVNDVLKRKRNVPGDWANRAACWSIIHHGKRIARNCFTDASIAMVGESPTENEKQATSDWGATLLRDIFGNPFRPVALDPGWLQWHGNLVVLMAQQMYESRDFSSMPVLADALEEAGCSDEQVLAHCRGPGPHVRGCFVVDLILGKS